MTKEDDRENRPPGGRRRSCDREVPMPIRLMTTREILDLAAASEFRGEYEQIEAMLSLANGCARSTHSFPF
jgi:hypothetical protein